MLREHNSVDKFFEEILGYVRDLSPELEKINSYLEDEKLYRLIKQDMARRRPKTTQTGRNSTPVEVILRMLVVKRLYTEPVAIHGTSYEETQWQVSDSLRLRQFCRVYLNAVPDDATLIRWANLIQPKTLEKFNERITQLAIERKVTCGRKMRTDGTVVDSNIRPPSDGRLLSDSVRVLARTVARAQTILKAARKKILDELEDFTQTAKGLSRKIGETLRSKKKEAQIAGRQQYEKLLDMTGQTIDWAVETQKQLQKQSQRRAKHLVETLNHFIPLARQAIKQTTRRILKGEQVPAREKIVSIFEEHTDIIVRGKEAKPVEYGHKIWLNEVEGGIVSHYRILDGNPSEEKHVEAKLEGSHQNLPASSRSGQCGSWSIFRPQ